MSSTTPSASKRGPSSTAAGIASVRDRLAAVLPQGRKFGVHHISTPPTRADPLCEAPVGTRADKTFKESHFLAVSIHPGNDKAGSSLKRASPGADHGKAPEAEKQQALVFAIEVLIFTTAYQTTLFVSKADSTGYLHLLDLPKGAPSPIRQVCGTFLAFLLDHRRRNRVQSVVNLFARAQAQYLFPGSVKNEGKHVLDDWGLVRWWCKVLNPLMEGLCEKPWASAKGYLLVPGLEVPETQAFIPHTTASLANWVIGHPLERISHYTRDFDSVPPRCLIPGYPDDPKSRFRDELDEEVSKQKQGIRAWKSVRSLEQFWEMMAFRQECSSGRLTGFVWLVFDVDLSPTSFSREPVLDSNPTTLDASVDSPLSAVSAPRLRADISSCTPRSSPSKTPGLPTVSASPPSKAAKKKTKKRKMSGRVVPRAPKIKTHARNYLASRPSATAYYYWPPEGRGDRLVDEAEYKRIVELLLHLDFSTLGKTVGSSQRWLNEVGMGDGTEGWVVGKAALADPPGAHGAAPTAARGGVTNLTGLVRKKNVSRPSVADGSQRVGSPPTVPGVSAATEPPTKQVNVLGASLVRKKRKNIETGEGVAPAGQ